VAGDARALSRLFHITSKAAAAEAVRSGVYLPAGFAAEGFVHCSYRHQVCSTANRLFAGRLDLVLLEIDRDRLACPVVDENLEGGAERFPHIYGPVPMEAVAAVHPFTCGASGRFELPAALG